MEDKQLIKWNNFVMNSLWGCVLLLERNCHVNLSKQLVSELVDPVLQAIKLFNQGRSGGGLDARIHEVGPCRTSTGTTLFIVTFVSDESLVEILFCADQEFCTIHGFCYANLGIHTCIHRLHALNSKLNPNP